MDDLAKRIMDKRGCQLSSAQQYVRTINRIIKDNGNDSKILTDYNKIISYVGGQNKMTTKRNYITAIIVYLKANDSKDTKLLERLGDLLKDMNETIDKDLSNGNKTEGQEKNWVDWNVILSIGPKIKMKIKGFDKDSEEYKQYYQDYLIYSLYTIISPLRNDYAEMSVITPTKYKKMTEEQKKQNNYIVGTDKIVINNYKMSKKHGPIIIELSNYHDIIPIIKGWYKINNSDYLLIQDDNKPMTPNNLTKRLQKIFKSYLNKSVSTSLLRHSYLSYKYGDTLKERQEDSEIMGHSMAQQDAYIKNK